MNHTLPWLLAVVLVGCGPRVTSLGSEDGGLDAGADGGCSVGPGPVKVMVMLDQSGSMCISDPPGSQQTPGFCESIASAVVPPGVTVPARVRALQSLTAALALRPEVTMALVPFDTNVRGEFPAGSGFVSAGDVLLGTRISGLQSQLGKATDYQGALEYAYAKIAADISTTKQSDPAIVARTQYVVIFLSDGVPFPRCSANDALATYADSTSPGGIWADSPGATSFCNDPSDGGADTITGFVPGTDRNQNAALFGAVDQLRGLVQQQGVGDVRFNTMLLLNPDNVALCGAICQDIYGVFPNVAATDYPTAALDVSRYTLQTLASHGGGAYTEFLGNGDGGVWKTSMTGFDLAAMTCP